MVREGLALEGGKGLSASWPLSSLAARWRAPWCGNTYPLVLHSLLRLVQYPLHLFYGHHLIGYKFLSLISEARNRTPYTKATCIGRAHGLAPLFLFK